MLKSHHWALALAGAVLSCPFPSFVAVALEPTAFLEDFAGNPAANGWNTFGDAALFRWNATEQNLEVTWDSAQPNSYFSRPLGKMLTREADFSLSFDLRLRDLAIGTTPGKPFTFELAIGFLNLAQATQSDFLRGTGTSSPNLVEFDYFPDSGFGATISPTIISSDMNFASTFNSPLELTLTDLFRVVLTYTADDEKLTTTITKNGQPFGPIKQVSLPSEFTDFQVDQVAIMSYSDAGQDPQFGGSILAHGVVDNFIVTVGKQATLDMALTGSRGSNGWQVEFDARPDWTYELHRTADFLSWTLVASEPSRSRGRMILSDPNAPTSGAQFYRVFGQQP